MLALIIICVALGVLNLALWHENLSLRRDRDSINNELGKCLDIIRQSLQKKEHEHE